MLSLVASCMRSTREYSSLTSPSVVVGGFRVSLGHAIRILFRAPGMYNIFPINNICYIVFCFLYVIVCSHALPVQIYTMQATTCSVVCCCIRKLVPLHFPWMWYCYCLRYIIIIYMALLVGFSTIWISSHVMMLSTKWAVKYMYIFYEMESLHNIYRVGFW